MRAQPKAVSAGDVAKLFSNLEIIADLSCEIFAALNARLKAASTPEMAILGDIFVQLVRLKSDISSSVLSDLLPSRLQV